ncbi:MAG: DUF4397 domain-containing protein, partial [Acidimicrobiia bacterium]|nr:DUF4397 domain-containing protein [Acidimicrobiia bacterium]
MPLKRVVFAAIAVLLASLVLAAPSAAQSEARIHLIHGIPGVDVDVEIGGEVAIGGFAFKDTQDLSDFAGQTLSAVQVKVAGTDDVAIDVGDLDLPSSGNITAIAHLAADGTPTLTVFSNDVSTLEAGQGRLVVRHTAAAPEVDVLAGGDVVFGGIANAGEAAADLPAGTVTASVVPAGATEPVVIGPADLPVTEGSALIVYAVGSLDDDTLDVITETIDGLDGSPTAVHTGNSPVDAGRSGATGAALLVGALVFAAVGGTAALRPLRARR